MKGDLAGRDRPDAVTSGRYRNGPFVKDRAHITPARYTGSGCPLAAARSPAALNRAEEIVIRSALATVAWSSVGLQAAKGNTERE